MRPYALRYAHLALHALGLKSLLLRLLLAVGYVVLALLAVSDGSLLQVLQLVLEGGRVSGVQARGAAAGPGGPAAARPPGKA